MITCQCAVAMPTYAANSSYLTPIPDANIDRGVIPLDSLPADWWNWLWNNITLNEGHIVQFINSVFSEINAVLSAAGVSPSTASTTDLRDAIQDLAQVVATASVPGSVLSSTLSGKLNVIADGTASINGLGTPSSLQTTATDVVSAINEVLSLTSGKAPKSHASSNDTYGVGTTQQFGHVKVTEGCGLAICDGTISLNAPGYNCLGNVTTICFNGNTYTPTDGVIDLGTQTVSVNCMCQRAITSSVSGDFYSLLGGGLCRNTTGVDTVNLTGLAWNPVCSSLAWTTPTGSMAIGSGSGTGSTATNAVAIGTGTYSCASFGIAIGYQAQVNDKGYGDISIGCCAYTASMCGCHRVAIGTGAHNGTCYGIAIGYQASSEWTCSVAIGCCACASCKGVAIGPGSYAGQFSCNSVCYSFSTVGDHFTFLVCTPDWDSGTTWGELSNVLEYFFRCKYKGPYSGCCYLFWAACGEAFCRSGASPRLRAENWIFTGSAAPPACSACSNYISVYWGNCWRNINSSCTDRAGWIDIANRVMISTGVIYGANFV